MKWSPVATPVWEAASHRDDVNVAALGYGAAVLADAAGVGSGAALAVLTRTCSGPSSSDAHSSIRRSLAW
jgi:hypothetical protein